MDFGKKQLEKYGWKEGQGLGKKEDGISTAIKPKLKFDNAGVGHSMSKEFTDNWWNDIYESALCNIDINNDDENVKMSLKNGESIDISTKGCLKDLKKHNITLEYGSFVKTSKLTQNGVIDYEKPSTSETDTPTKIQILNDEELFAACGGRTAHKGARHGLKLSGKLSRLEKQEKILLKKLQNVSLHDETSDIERKMKKITKHRDKNKYHKDDKFGILNYEDDSMSSSSSTSKKHKKKKKHKSVSFNKTVTEYHTHDLDSSVHSSDSNENSNVLTIIEKSEIKDEETERNNLNDTAVFDEGIEQDIETGEVKECSHKSFEEAQDNKTEKLSKAEKKLRKKQNRGTATIRFLQEVNVQTDNENNLLRDNDECKKCSKRKQEEDHTSMVLSSKRYCEYDGAAGSTLKQSERKKNKKKRIKKEKKQQKRIDSITKSLDKICKISDNK